jgi:hypothetical protein
MFDLLDRGPCIFSFSETYVGRTSIATTPAMSGKAKSFQPYDFNGLASSAGLQLTN